MAAVYEAHHERNKSRVAVKMLHRQNALSTEQVARFQREGYVANKVGHAGVVEIFDDDVLEDGCSYLVMEFLDGETIAERAAARGGSLPEREVLELADHVLDVLVAAHERSILHRDIKPDNLFMTKDGTLKVLDFGIARLNEAELHGVRTQDGTVLGAPAFMPPEQARGRIDEIDARTDVWALGATMFTLLTGRFVHRATTANEQLGMAMTRSAPLLRSVAPELHRGLIKIVDRALEYDPSRRWPNARTMQSAVRSLLERRKDWKRALGKDDSPAAARSAEGSAVPTLRSDQVASWDGASASDGVRSQQSSLTAQRSRLWLGVTVALVAAALAYRTTRQQEVRVLSRATPAVVRVARLAPRSAASGPVASVALIAATEAQASSLLKSDRPASRSTALERVLPRPMARPSTSASPPPAASGSVAASSAQFPPVAPPPKRRGFLERRH
jgi:serine/threonine-protein kinase